MKTAAAVQLEYTGERVVPGMTPEITFREHQMRYAFAGQFVPGRIVLDIASGSGIGTDYLRRAGARACFGLDLNRAALGYARSRFGLCHLAACDAARLCLARQSVEVVVSFETIEHLPDPLAFLAECERVLRPGGLLICSTPNREITRWDQENPFHVAEMPVRDFSHQVNEFFRDSRLYGQGPVPYPLYVARKKIAGTLKKLNLKEWVKRRLRLPVNAVCSEVEFADCNRDERYAVSPRLPRWPNRSRYAIVVARKSSESVNENENKNESEDQNEKGTG
jgi:2-polyprenyl-3-methyl-5-hydroxy-6-metoxy-1,4-benzoquinol methylase